MRYAILPAALILVATRASARPNDLDLAGLVTKGNIIDSAGARLCQTPSPAPGSCSQASVLATPRFKALALELGAAVGPHVHNPGATLGEMGFSFGFSTAITDVNQNGVYWQTATQSGLSGGTPDGVLAVNSIHIRKALPFSVELGGNFGYLMNSSMWALGMEVKWGINEGFYYIPDFALRGSVAVLQGSRDLQLVSSGVDFTISKSFGIGGAASLTPYIGYFMLIVNGSSHVLDPTPRNADDVDNNFVFNPETLLAHRMFLGLRLKTYFVAIAFAFEHTFPAEGAAGMSTFLAKLAFNF